MAKRIRNKIEPLDFVTCMYDNFETYQDYLDRMTKICLSMFEWENLPETMDARYIERCLFFDGKAALLKTNEYGAINTRACTNGFINIYGLPSALNCYTEGNVYRSDRKVFNGLVDMSDENFNFNDYAVLVLNQYNDYDMKPTAFTIRLFAERLYLAQRVCDININAQKTPIILLGSDQQKLTLENLYTEYDGNKPIIYGDKDIITNEAFKAIKVDAPFVTDKVTEYKKQIWNEFLSFIGVNTIDVEKKERLIKGEASSNNEYINFNLQSYLIPRQKAADEFSKLLGLTGDKKIKVKVRSDLMNIIKSNESVVADYIDDGSLNNSVDGGDSNE